MRAGFQGDTPDLPRSPPPPPSNPGLRGRWAPRTAAAPADPGEASPHRAKSHLSLSRPRGAPVPPGLGRLLRPAPAQPSRLPLSRRSLTAAEPAAAPPEQRPEPPLHVGRYQSSAGQGTHGPALRPAPAGPVRTARRERRLLRPGGRGPLAPRAPNTNCRYPWAGSSILA